MQSRTILRVLAVAMVVGVLSMVAVAATTETGNGAPSGEHYNLNIIGVSNPKNVNMDQAAGNVIFVPLVGKIGIKLYEGADFAVLDKNGTDGWASFQLPDPGLDPYVVGNVGDADVMSDYSVFVRSVGTPGGYATITTCADVVQSELLNFLSAQDAKVLNKAAELGGVASIEQVGQTVTLRDSGKSTFENVTAQLLTIVLQIAVDVNGDGVFEQTVYARVPIFDDMLQNEYWEYDNNGLKLLQVRFYPGVATDVSQTDLYLPAL